MKMVKLMSVITSASVMLTACGGGGGESAGGGSDNTSNNTYVAPAQPIANRVQAANTLAGNYRLQCGALTRTEIAQGKTKPASYPYTGTWSFGVGGGISVDIATSPTHVSVVNSLATRTNEYTFAFQNDATPVFKFLGTVTNQQTGEDAYLGWDFTQNGAGSTSWPTGLWLMPSMSSTNVYYCTTSNYPTITASDFRALLPKMIDNYTGNLLCRQTTKADLSKSTSASDYTLDYTINLVNRVFKLQAKSGTSYTVDLNAPVPYNESYEFLKDTSGQNSDVVWYTASFSDYSGTQKDQDFSFTFEQNGGIYGVHYKLEKSTAPSTKILDCISN